MIHIVTEDNRHLFRHALMEMHRQRKTIFMDELRWGLEAPDGLEIDQFDAADAVYLIEADDPRGEISASARLLPTDRPHLLGEIFPHLCDGGVPTSPRIWEVSRFCPAPRTPRGTPRRAALARMIAGILETGLLFGLEEVTFVASAALAPLALKIGWQARRLGAGAGRGRERVHAIAASVSQESLRAVRVRNGLTGPLTRYAAPGLADAA